MGPAAWVVQGDARRIPLRDESVQCVVTSPPYWGLRDYRLEPLVWGREEEAAGCDHEWGQELPGHHPGQVEQTKWKDAEAAGKGQTAASGSFCARCSAWCGSLGLEPTPELYLEHLVEIFREVRRVLRRDGVCWLNMGDCYATGAGKVGGAPGGGEQGAWWAGDVDRLRDKKRGYRGERLDNTDGGGVARRKTVGIGPMTQPNRMPLPGLKAKDLVGMPWALAFALRADGWWLRRDIIWSKPNPMPESVEDRPSSSHEYLFLLAKSERYYYDRIAILEPAAYAHEAKWDADRKTGKSTRRFSSAKVPAGWNSGPTSDDLLGRHPARAKTAVDPHAGGRRQAPEPGEQDAFSVMPDGQLGRNRRSVWEIATAPFPGAHFATFPPALVIPCIKAGTSERGACIGCGAPWKPVIETDYFNDTTTNGRPARGNNVKGLQAEAGELEGGKTLASGVRTRRIDTTLGWRSTCSCGLEALRPCVVLDPFAGAGTVLMVAQELGRIGIGLDLKWEYLLMARKRTAQGVLL